MSDGKMFHCAICGEEVSKRQSVAYGTTHLTATGVLPRACRKHPEVIREMQERLAAEEAKRHAALEQKMRAKGFRHFEHKIPTGPSCWHCKQEGVTAQAHWLRMMIAAEKCSLNGKSFLDGQAMKDAYGEFKPVMVFLKCWEGHDLVKGTQDGMMFWSMSDGHMFICQACAAKFNLIPEWEKGLAPREVTPEALQVMMAVSEALPITHACRAQAKAEVAADKGYIAVIGNEVQP